MKSHRMRIALSSTGACAFVLSLGSPASAFIRLTRDNGAGGVVQAHWRDSDLPLKSVVNPNNADISAAAALAIVQASAQSWQDIPTSYFTVSPVEYTGAPDQVTPALDA